MFSVLKTGRDLVNGILPVSLDVVAKFLQKVNQARLHRISAMNKVAPMIKRFLGTWLVCGPHQRNP